MSQMKTPLLLDRDEARRDFEPIAPWKGKHREPRERSVLAVVAQRDSHSRLLATRRAPPHHSAGPMKPEHIIVLLIVVWRVAYVQRRPADEEGLRTAVEGMDDERVSAARWRPARRARERGPMSLASQRHSTHVV